MRLIVGFIFIFLGSSLIGNAQSKKYSSREKNQYWEAESYYVQRDYKEAAKRFEEIKSIDPNYAELYYYLGNSYFALDLYDDAEAYLLKGAAYNSDAYYQLASIKLYYGELDSADYFIELFEKSNREETAIQTHEWQQLKSNIETARVLLSNGEVVNIINLGSTINTQEDEYVPLISSDEELLLFTSKRVEDSPQLDPNGNPFENVYFSTNLNATYGWSKAKLLEGDVNTSKHDACVGLSPDGNTLYLFRTNDNLIGGDIYESLNINGKWTTPVRMSNSINGYESIEPSASISLDGLTFYFSSNRVGGFGGFDLYRVKKLPNGEWSLPLNLGDQINTPLDEDAPFIHPDGKTLYFSSKGHTNMGGYDIFRSELIDEEWSKPQNLGYPTNSTKNDIFFTISANERHGYYSSNKEGGFGGQDIYLIDYLEKSLRQSVIAAFVSDEEGVVASEISLINIETGELEGVYLSNPTTGKFIFLVNPDVEYELIVETKGYEEYIETVNYSKEDLMTRQKLNLKLTKSTSDVE